MASTDVRRLIADIGGTNARFALLEGRQWRNEMVLACADYPDIVSAVEHYLGEVGASTSGTSHAKPRWRSPGPSPAIRFA